MTIRYDKSIGIASTCKDGAAPHSVQVSGDTQPNPNRGGKKLLDQFREKMRSLHYALTTEKCYRHWIVEFLRFHRAGGGWRHPGKMGKLEIEAFLSHLASVRKVSAKTQNQAFSAMLSTGCHASATHQAHQLPYATPQFRHAPVRVRHGQQSVKWPNEGNGTSDAR